MELKSLDEVSESLDEAHFNLLRRSVSQKYFSNDQTVDGDSSPRTCLCHTATSSCPSPLEKAIFNFEPGDSWGKEFSTISHKWNKTFPIGLIKEKRKGFSIFQTTSLCYEDSRLT